MSHGRRSACGGRQDTWGGPGGSPLLNISFVGFVKGPIKFVYLPFPLPQTTPNEKTEKSLKRWQMIVDMPDKFDSSYQLEKHIKSYNPSHRDWNFDLLHQALDKAASHEREDFYNNVLPGIVKLTKQLPELCSGKLPLLISGDYESVSLPKKKIASLLANAFFCTFPYRNDQTPGTMFENYPSINFNSLYKWRPGKLQGVNAEKLKCLFNYFKRVSHEDVNGQVKFTRMCSPHKVNWANSTLKMRGFYMQSLEARIEDSEHIQVDFANKKIGGGVIGRGCVQEEIRFITCPELIVARLFTEKLGDDEALVVQGVEQYVNYEGYQESFTCTGSHKDDPKVAAKRTMVAIDALDYSNMHKHPGFASKCVDSLEQMMPKVHSAAIRRNISDLAQYSKVAIDRELHKAYIGFRCAGILPNAAIATGNWGGGCFKGDPILKAKIQHLAASEVGRDLHYFPFSDPNLKREVDANKIIGPYVHDGYNEILIYAKKKLESISKMKPSL